MPGLVPGTHVFSAASKTWVAGTSPAMTHISFYPRALAERRTLTFYKTNSNSQMKTKARKSRFPITAEG
jgi:hypothetical protein